MYYHDAVGIAAPQVGEHVRLFVLDAAKFGRSRMSSALVFINPEIIATSEEKERRREGCLSFPGHFVHLKRARWVTVRFLDQDGDTKELCTEGDALLSQAVQHEYDHLFGRLMVEHLDQKTRRKLEQSLERR